MIKQATIYGFGKWIDYSIDFSKKKFICICGENESGKSTIQQFILFMLFGLPPKQRAFYRPKTSGKMGGRLTVIDPVIGEYIIERLDEVQNGAARCYVPDGKEYGEEWLKDRLKGMTKEIYQSVYSFSALDLKDFKQMKGEDIGEVLLGIGLTGSNNIYQVEKQLVQKIGELFKPTGKIPKINQHLDSLDELFQQLNTYKNNEATYQNKQEQLETTHNEINHLQRNLQEIREAKQTNERFRNNLSLINDYHMYKEQLEKYPSEIKFPEDGLERLNQLKEKLLPLQSRLSILKSNQTKNEIEQAKLKEQLDEDVFEKSQVILMEKDHYREQIREQKNIQAKSDMLHIKLETSLQELNVGLTIEQLENISLPFYLEEKWNVLKSETDRLEVESEQLHQELTGLEKQRAFLTDQVTSIKAKLLSPEQLEELYSQIDAYKEADYRNKLQEETSKKQSKWAKDKKRKEKRMNSILIGSLVIGLVLGGIGLILEQSLLYNFMVIMVMLGLGQWLLGKKGIKETSDLLASREILQDFSSNITESQKQEADQLLMKYDENRSTLASLQDQLKSIDIQFIQCNERNLGLKQRKLKLDEQIAEQLADYPFLERVEINYWPEFYHTLKQLLNMSQEQQRYKNQVENITKQLLIYTNKVNHFVKKVDPSFEDHSLNLQIEMLENIVKKHEQKKQTKERIADDIAENMSQQDEVIHQMNVYEQEIQTLFVVGKVDSEDEFYKKSNQRLEKKALEESIQKVGGQLKTIFPEDAWLEIAKHKPDQSKLEVECEQIDEEIQEIEENIHGKRQQLANLHADLAKMESSETYSQTMHQYTMEKEELTKMAKEWAVLKTAKEMLVETKKKYRDKYLTDVIDLTSIYFKKITMNAYEFIVPPQDGKPFQAESADRIRYQVNELSQGTIDQLYVCLRLAISEIMSREHHLPFIIDDAFVHFDARRTKQVMRILEEIGEQQQIILFTCNQEVANIVSDSHTIHLLENVVSTN